MDKSSLIGYFQITLGVFLKASVGAYPFIWYKKSAMQVQCKRNDISSRQNIFLLRLFYE